MMENIPVYVVLLFMATALTTLLLFYVALLQPIVAAARKQAGKNGFSSLANRSGGTKLKSYI